MFTWREGPLPSAPPSWPRRKPPGGTSLPHSIPGKPLASMAKILTRMRSEYSPSQSTPASQTMCLPVPGSMPSPMSPVKEKAGME